MMSIARVFFGVLLCFSFFLSIWCVEQLKAERAAYEQHRVYTRVIEKRARWLEEHHEFWKRLLEAREGREREQRRREMWIFERGEKA
jgi:hypothetical protein